MSGMAMSFSLAKSILRDVRNSSINSCGMCFFPSPRTTSSLGKVSKWPTSQAVFTNSLSKLTESADVDSTSWERNHANASSLSICSSCRHQGADGNFGTMVSEVHDARLRFIVHPPVGFLLAGAVLHASQDFNHTLGRQ